MKFNCGPTWEERLAKKKLLANTHKQEDEQWHKWFAWYPVSVGKKDCRFMETVERIFIGVELWYVHKIPMCLFIDGATGYELRYEEVNYRPLKD